jgi:hypothetical protein
VALSFFTSNYTELSSTIPNFYSFFRRIFEDFFILPRELGRYILKNQKKFIKMMARAPAAPALAQRPRRRRGEDASPVYVR